MPYFVRARGKVVGPFDQGKLQALLKQGKLGRSHEISENKIEWKRASEYEFLFQAKQIESLSGNSAPPNLPSPITPETNTATSYEEWFFSLDGETTTGPISQEELMLQITQRRVDKGTLAWRIGDSSSASLGTFPEFAGLLNSQDSSAMPNSSISNTPDATSSGVSTNLPSDLIIIATKSRGWIVFLYVCFGICLVSGFLSSFRLGPAGILLFITLVPGILSCVSLIKYASSLGVVLLKQDDTSLQKSFVYLNGFFLWSSVWIIVWMMLFLVLIVTVASGEYVIPHP